MASTTTAICLELLIGISKTRFYIDDAVTSSENIIHLHNILVVNKMGGSGYLRCMVIKESDNKTCGEKEEQGDNSGNSNNP